MGSCFVFEDLHRGPPHPVRRRVGASLSRGRLPVLSPLLPFPNPPSFFFLRRGRSFILKPRLRLRGRTKGDKRTPQKHRPRRSRAARLPCSIYARLITFSTQFRGFEGTTAFFFLFFLSFFLNYPPLPLKLSRCALPAQSPPLCYLSPRFLSLSISLFLSFFLLSSLPLSLSRRRRMCSNITSGVKLGAPYISYGKEELRQDRRGKDCRPAWYLANVFIT